MKLSSSAVYTNLREFFEVLRKVFKSIKMHHH